MKYPFNKFSSSLADQRPDRRAPRREVHVPLHDGGDEGPLERPHVRPNHLQTRPLRGQEPGMWYNSNDKLQIFLPIKYAITCSLFYKIHREMLH